MVNDSIGHAGGDQLLIEAAERLSAVVRETDTVARLGGDEFVILCPDLPDRAQAIALAERVRTVVEHPVRDRRQGGFEPVVTCSASPFGGR